MLRHADAAECRQPLLPLRAAAYTPRYFRVTLSRCLIRRYDAMMPLIYADYRLLDADLMPNI